MKPPVTAPHRAVEAETEHLKAILDLPAQAGVQRCRLKESATSNCEPRRSAKIIRRDVAMRHRIAGAHVGSVPVGPHKMRYLRS